MIDLNEQALSQMQLGLGAKMVIVPGASHLFEEPGALEEAAHLSRDWFQMHLSNVHVG